MTHVTAILLAAGEGRRMGGDPPKPYLPIAGRPLVLRALDRIFSSSHVEKVILVVAAADMKRCELMLGADVALRDRPWFLQVGGATRQQSAHRGLEKITPDTDIVMIHDAARPFASAALIERCIEAAAIRGAAVPGLPVRDTIKVVSPDHRIQSTPERKSLWEIQTPQAFKRELIVAAHGQAERDGLEVTDDAMVVERLGKPVYLVEGERTNFKITLPEDVWFAEVLIREGKIS
jgi:2-C-methyl-D-erythritol 4-phosphate cytidylyltransferase